MILTTLQEVELFLSEIYCRVVNEFPLLQGTDLKLKVYSAENFILLVDNINKYKNLNNTQRKLRELLKYSIELISESNNQANPRLESVLIELLNDYLEIDPDYSQQINIELHRRPFNLENKQHKKYLKLKKEKLFLELINTIYTEQSYGWKSVSNVVDVTYNRYMAEFKKFDVAWLEDEILKKENYLPKINSLFVTKELVCKVVGKLERNKDLETVLCYETIPDLKRIKSETIKTEKEIEILNQLLNTLRSTYPDQNLLKKYLPYYGDGEDTSLRKLLKNNEQLKNAIIFKKG